MKKQLKTLAGTGEDSTTATARAAEELFVDTLCQQIASLNTFRYRTAHMHNACMAAGTDMVAHCPCRATLQIEVKTLLFFQNGAPGHERPHAD